jgi:hypothetical protein
MKPTIGRIVHFSIDGERDNDVPAIITQVWTDTCVNLTVFHSGASPKFEISVRYDPKGATYTWHWPQTW